MDKDTLLLQSGILDFLDYCPDTGAFTWLARPPGLFRTAKAAKTWNSRFTGAPAMRGSHNTGYLCGGINGHLFLSHRVAWMKHYGSLPPMFIDHINGDRTDNRICNLRAATKAGNARNQCIRINNTSGVLGVVKRSGRWLARIHANGKEVFLGSFHTLEEAAAARAAAKVQFGYDDDHGRARKNSK